MTSFRETYPIDFDLYDKDTQNVLYIEDTSDQTLTLEIKNASTQTIDLADLTASTVSSSNYHFALRFRPGTLSSATLTGIALATDTAQNWEMAPPETDTSGMDVVYLKSTSASLSMDPDSLQTLVFNNVGADAGQGTRGTRVALEYRNMAFSSALTEEIISNREIHLNVINHRGKQNIPLHVGFVGDNGVLNDGSTNALKLRFSNTLVYDNTNPDVSALTFSHDADTTLRSRFILYFDIGASGQDDDWGMATESGVANIVITPPTGWAIETPVSGEIPEWILYPDTADQVLYGRYHPDPNAANDDPNPFLHDYFDLDLSSIITIFPTGHTHLHIQYENILGYWDGQLKVKIEKRPLIYYEDANDNRNVGIGTTAPSEKLTVAAGEFSLYGTGLDGTSLQKFVLYSNTTYGLHFDAPKDSAGDKLPIQFNWRGGGTPPLYINGDGQVGIGTDSPGSKIVDPGPPETKILYKLDVAGITSSQGLRIPGLYDFGNLYESGIEMEVATGHYNAIRAYSDNEHVGTIQFFDDTWQSGAAGSSAGAINIAGEVAVTIGEWNNPVAYFKNHENPATNIDGNVGIGTTDPQATLDVAGIAHFDGDQTPSTPVQGAYIGWNAFTGGTGETDFINCKGQGTGGFAFYNIADNTSVNSASPQMRIDGDGNVGIGTTAPTEKLDVNGSVKVSGKIEPSAGNGTANGIVFPANPGGGSGDIASIQYYAPSGSGENMVLELKIENDPGTDHIALMPSGNVGIGTTNPEAKLEVTGTGNNKTIADYNYMGHGVRTVLIDASKANGVVTNVNRDNSFPDLDRNGNGGTFAYSIYASGMIACSEMHVHCDERIKKDRIQSNTKEDLETLLSIQITDYTHIDPLVHGSKPQKKVLGQQLAAVYPQAVNMRKGVVVPDIMQHTASDANGEIALENHGLKAGEKVQLLYQENGEDKTEVFSVLEAGENSFRVELSAVEELFVYGREVDDFHLVDFDALSALNISATQELCKRIARQDQIIEDLLTRMAALEAKLG